MKFDLREVLAVACAAYRVNGKVVKHNEDKTPTNKDLIIDYFSGKYRIEVTEDDYEKADEVRSTIQHRSLMLQIASKSQSEFNQSVTEILQSDTVLPNKFGMIAWAPSIANSFQKEDQQKLDIAKMSFISNYVGSVGDKVTINFTPIRVRFARDYNCFRHFGHDEHGNLIGFLNKQELSGTIVGRVKNQEVSKYNNGAKVTYLNYVKVVK